MYSVKTQNELVFKEAIEALVNKYPEQVSVDMLCTREGDARMNADTIKEALTKRNLLSKNLFCYSCGPQSLILDSTKYLLSLGISKENIKYELWFSSLPKKFDTFDFHKVPSSNPGQDKFFLSSS